MHANRYEPHILFGKGRIGGVDQDLQKKSAAAAFVHTDQQEEFKAPEDRRDRDRHWSKKSLAEMTSRDWRIFREDHDITLKGSKAPLPIRDWKESSLLPDFVCKALDRAGFSKPMDVQVQGIPIGLERKDMIAIAPTGSGKSVAYLAPLICCLSSLPPMDEKNFDDGISYEITPDIGPRGIILTPTRELAIQVDEEFKKMAYYTKLTSAVVVGGVIPPST